MYICTICGRCFKWSGNHRLHMETHKVEDMPPIKRTATHNYVPYLYAGDPIFRRAALQPSELKASQVDVSDVSVSDSGHDNSEDIPLDKQQLVHIVTTLELAEDGKFSLTKGSFQELLDDFICNSTDTEDEDLVVDEEQNTSSEEEDESATTLSSNAIDILRDVTNAAQSGTMQLSKGLLRQLLESLNDSDD
jgi:hypothetical protein